MVAALAPHHCLACACIVGRRLKEKAREYRRRRYCTDACLLDALARGRAYREIPGAPGYYATDDGRIFSRVSEIKPEDQGKGGLRVQVTVGGETKHKFVHRLVYAAYHGQIPDGAEVCHNDGLYTNNDPDNLRADTHKGNCADKVRHGTDFRGSRHPRAQVDEETIRQLKRALDVPRRKGDVRRIAAEHGVSYHIAYELTRGRGWRHVQC